VREVEEQRQHAEVDQHESGQRCLHRIHIVGFAACDLQKVPAGKHQHAGDQATEEQVDGNLPAPDAQHGIDQRVVTGGGGLEHRSPAQVR